MAHEDNLTDRLLGRLGAGDSHTTFIFSSGLMAEILVGHEIPEGYRPDPLHPTLRRGVHVVALTCWAPPTAAPTEADFKAALEAELVKVIAEDNRLAAQAAALPASAAERVRLAEIQRRAQTDPTTVTLDELRELAKSKGVVLPKPEPGTQAAGEID